MTAAFSRSRPQNERIPVTEVIGLKGSLSLNASEERELILPP